MYVVFDITNYHYTEMSPIVIISPRLSPGVYQESHAYNQGVSAISVNHQSILPSKQLLNVTTISHMYGNGR